MYSLNDNVSCLVILRIAAVSILRKNSVKLAHDVVRKAAIKMKNVTYKVSMPKVITTCYKSNHIHYGWSPPEILHDTICVCEFNRHSNCASNDSKHTETYYYCHGYQIKRAFIMGVYNRLK